VLICTLHTDVRTLIRTVSKNDLRRVISGIGELAMKAVVVVWAADPDSVGAAVDEKGTICIDVAPCFVGVHRTWLFEHATAKRT
jgi:hypothetical protein